jgi:hypothetical protein
MATQISKNVQEKGDSMMNTMSSPVAIFGVTSIILFISSFVMFSKYVGSKRDWNYVQNYIQSILVCTIIGTIAFTIAVMFYFIQDASKAIYFVLILSCISLGLSYSALTIAAISKK